MFFQLSASESLTVNLVYTLYSRENKVVLEVLLMTIKEVEERTGLSRSNVRFYEKEKLIFPERNESNGYRVYSDQDIEDIKKIAYLRTLGIPIEDLRNVISEKMPLREAVQRQKDVLENQISEAARAKLLCEEMLGDQNMDYSDLNIEQYVTNLEEYWSDNTSVFHLDSIGFLNLWGSFRVWAVMTLVCLIIALWSYGKLPSEIPVQWSEGQVSSWGDKAVIFGYPAACLLIRYLIRPAIYAKLQRNFYHKEIITEYLANVLCFIALSTEIFSILYIYGLVKHLPVVLLVDILVFSGLLLMGFMKMNRAGKKTR